MQLNSRNRSGFFTWEPDYIAWEGLTGRFEEQVVTTSYNVVFIMHVSMLQNELHNPGMCYTSEIEMLIDMVVVR